MLERAVAAAAVAVVAVVVGTKHDTMIIPKYPLQENSL
jgi:hypothetical protein